MADHVIHISEVEAASDFAAVLARVRAGAEVVIESEGGKLPVAVIHPPVPPRRTISECIACCPRTRRRSWMPTSPGISRQPSRVSANRLNHPHGTDPRF